MDGTGAQDGKLNEADTERQISHISYSWVEAKRLMFQNRIE